MAEISYRSGTRPQMLGIAGTRLAWIILLAALWPPVATSASACDGTQHVRLVAPVELSNEEQAEFGAMPPLRVLSVDAPPLTRYDANRRTYTGVSVDVWCFIADQLGLRFEIVPGRDETVAEKISQIQNGDADVFMPLSRTPERALHGIFTHPHYQSYYAVIAHQGRQVVIDNIKDLADYHVGVVRGVAFEAILKDIVPASQLHIYDQTSSDGLFQAVRDKTIDVAVFNKNIFLEKRYHGEYFDLEDVYTLRDYPLDYRFYFSSGLPEQRLVEVFDRYLAAIDIADAVAEHEEGEQELIERYVAQRSQKAFLQAASVITTLLALMLYVALRKYRNLTRRLAAMNSHVVQQQEELQEAYQKLEKQSQTDSLTRLANRRRFDRALTRAYEHHKQQQLPLSLLIIDVDHFKSVNDHYGHAVGDEYLRAIAQVLQHSLRRSTDLAARYGGEEFACLLPDTEAADAYAVAERIREGVATLGLVNASATTSLVTLSIGVATLSDASISALDLLGEADAQLYAAKRAGRDRIRAVVIGSENETRQDGDYP